MTNKKTTIANALFTKTQQQVLKLLFGRPAQSFYTKEIVRIAGIGMGTVQRELLRLTEAGLITATLKGNQKHYQANPDCPVFEELRGIVLKTFGLVDVLADALAPLSKQIEVAFVFGSMASGKENSGSDVDLLLVGDVAYNEVVKVLYPAQEILGREINPKLFSVKEWGAMLLNKGVFTNELLAKPKLFVLGASNEFG
ncbi:MAG TPA: hypothetical protein ENK35_05660 [Candidatus Tenderia sp.]|nr:hypothetical protein [Candidatus Tenderia sp.]